MPAKALTIHRGPVKTMTRKTMMRMPRIVADSTVDVGNWAMHSSGDDMTMKPRYVVQRIRAPSVLYGPTHYATDDEKQTLCGQKVDGKWLIERVRGTMTASPDCIACNEAAKGFP